MPYLGLPPTTDPQVIFDFVVAHLRRQNAKARDSEGCLYRAPNGMMCAAGCLISDKEYDPAIENECAAGLPILIEKYGRDNTDDLIDELQTTHDSWPIEKWEERFQYCANEFGLVFTPRSE